MDFDFDTISTSDYSIEFQVSETMWKAFINNYYDPDNLFSEIGQFRLYIHNAIEQRVSFIDDDGVITGNYAGSQEIVSPDRISSNDQRFGLQMGKIVSMVQFAYNNNEVINDLYERAEYIKTENYQALKLKN